MSPRPVFRERVRERAFWSECYQVIDRRLIGFAKELRTQGTDAERRIWSHLRAGRLNGHKFRRQHPIGNYIADFYCHSARLVIELDGGQHDSPDAVAYDTQRTQWMETEGVRVVRFSDVEALRDTEAVVASILREVESSLAVTPSFQPSPGVPGEGV